MPKLIISRFKTEGEATQPTLIELDFALASERFRLTIISQGTLSTYRLKSLADNQLRQTTRYQEADRWLSQLLAVLPKNLTQPTNLKELVVAANYFSAHTPTS